MRDVKIKKVLNGFRVKIGCQEVVFGSKKKLLRELERYIDNPEKVEDEYKKKYNKDMVQGRFVHVRNETYGPIGFVVADDEDTME